MNPPLAFKLSGLEQNTPLWTKIRLELQTMLQTRREDNDATMSEAQTARLRGEISVLKEIMDWDKEQVPYDN